MSRFSAMIACIRSGQLSPAQIAAELRDPDFAAFYRQMIGDAGAGCGAYA